MMRLLNDMTAKEYLNEVNKNDGHLLHFVCGNNEYDCLKLLVDLPYFKDIVNVPSKSEIDGVAGWTPLMTNVRANTNGAQFHILKLMADNGADLMLGKGDGANAMHFAASNNDIHLMDFLFKETK